MIKNKRKKPEPQLTADQVAADAKRFFTKAIDSGKFCIFIGYVENDKLEFSEHRTAMHLGDLFTMQSDIELVISKASIPVQKARILGQRKRP